MRTVISVDAVLMFSGNEARLVYGNQENSVGMYHNIDRRMMGDMYFSVKSDIPSYHDPKSQSNKVVVMALRFRFLENYWRS
jgi:hypothetical protein